MMPFTDSISVFDNTQYVYAAFSQIDTFEKSVLSSFHINQKLNDHVKQIVPVVRAIVNLSVTYKVELGL